MSDNQLAVIVQESGLESTKAAFILETFQDYFKIAAEWELKAKAIVVTDESQTAEMKMARVGRLFLKEKRVAIEKARKELKDQSLREGKAIDGISNVLKGLIIPIEQYLNQQERFVEIKAEIAEKKRLAEEERKAEEERLAIEAEERAEQERIRVENEKLKADAVEKERLLAEERRKADEAQARADAANRAAEQERINMEKKLAADREAAEEKECKAAAEIERLKRAAEEKKKSMVTCPFCHKEFSLED